MVLYLHKLHNYLSNKQQEYILQYRHNDDIQFHTLNKHPNIQYIVYIQYRIWSINQLLLIDTFHLHNLLYKYHLRQGNGTHFHISHSNLYYGIHRSYLHNHHIHWMLYYGINLHYKRQMLHIPHHYQNLLQSSGIHLHKYYKLNYQYNYHNYLCKSHRYS